MSVVMSSSNTERPITAEYNSIAEMVLTAVAEREDTSPTSLDPLYDVIDPDALNGLFAPTNGGNARASGRVVFSYCGYEVTVTSDGSVRVDEHTTSSVVPESPANSTASEE